MNSDSLHGSKDGSLTDPGHSPSHFLWRCVRARRPALARRDGPRRSDESISLSQIAITADHCSNGERRRRVGSPRRVWCSDCLAAAMYSQHSVSILKSAYALTLPRDLNREDSVSNIGNIGRTIRGALTSTT